MFICRLDFIKSVFYYVTQQANLITWKEDVFRRSVHWGKHFFKIFSFTEVKGNVRTYYVRNGHSS
jgi:hypothetical protein